MTSIRYEQHEFNNINNWSKAVAEGLADAIQEKIKNSNVLLLVSGGSTPGPIFDELSTITLPWERVVISLVDERWVPQAHEWSNTSLVKKKLIKNRASKACWQPITTDDALPINGLDHLNHSFKSLLQLPRVVLLGMGSDSHTASLFPDMMNEPAMKATANGLFAVQEAGSPRCARITFGLGTLIQSDYVALAITGDDKKSVLAHSLQPGSCTPIGLVIQKSRHPVHVFWRP